MDNIQSIQRNQEPVNLLVSPSHMVQLDALLAQLLCLSSSRQHMTRMHEIKQCLHKQHQHRIKHIEVVCIVLYAC